METININRPPEWDTSQFDDIEGKIKRIENDIIKNHVIIKNIKDTVLDISKSQSEDIQKIKSMFDVVDSDKEDKPVVQMQIEPQKTYIELEKSLVIPKDMCSLEDTPASDTDVKILNLFEILPFDDVDGGVWKQGWQILYDRQQWQKKKLKVFVVPHTHTDPGWVKTFSDYYNQQTKPIFENIVNKLEEDPTYKFMYAEMSFFSEWWREIDDAKKARVKQLIKNGQFEIVSGGWVMTDEANTHYSAMIDQMIEGHQWLDGTVGVKPEYSWSIDPFGHSPTMSYMLKRMGFKSMLIQRIHYHMKKHLAKNKQLEFKWRQQWDGDGTTDIFCHVMPFYSYDVPHTCGPDPKVCCQFDFRRMNGKISCPWKIKPVAITDENVEERAFTLLDQYRKKSQLYNTNVVLAILGDDFRYDKADEWDLQFKNYQKLFQYMNSNSDLDVEIQFGTLGDYFKAIHQESGVEPGESLPNMPSLSGDFFVYADRQDHYWSGYYTSRPFYKQLDRVMEYHQRAAEIIFTNAVAQARRDVSSKFPIEVFMSKLMQSRRDLGLFQHHDGITGTAKDFVVVDYGKRLLNGLMNMKRLIVEAASYLMSGDKEKYEYEKENPMFSLDESRPSHDSLPIKTVITVKDEPSPVLLYNSLGQKREQVVRIYVDQPNIEICNPEGSVIVSQTDPFWTTKEDFSENIFKVSFLAIVPALGISRYTVKKVGATENSLNQHVSVVMYNTDGSANLKRSPFLVRREEASAFSLENFHMKADFSSKTGMLESVTTKADGMKHQSNVEFIKFGVAMAKEKSGAYLFLPNGPGTPIEIANPLIRIIRGSILAEVHVFLENVQHTVRLHNSPGVDGASVDIYNIVDIRSESNKEIAMRISTDVQNTDSVFYTDLNGFQMQKRKTYEKLPIQANLYPVPTMAFMEDSQTRFSVLTGQSLGIMSPVPGRFEVMMDRRLNQDDNRGLGQGVLDNKVTPNKFKLLFEKRHSPAKKTDVKYPSLLAQVASLQLIHPTFIIPKNSQTNGQELLPSLSLLSEELPCEIHLLNLRIMQNSEDDNDLRYVPKKTSALLLHRLGFDCSFPSGGLACKTADSKVIFSNLFSQISDGEKIQKMTLSLLQELEEINPKEPQELEPMEIYTYKVALH
ncbi:hypothetical protein ScPMuIL_002828 [Solemya velum]